MAASLVRNVRLCAKSTKKVLAVRVSVVNPVSVYGINSSLAWENRGCIFRANCTLFLREWQEGE